MLKLRIGFVGCGMAGESHLEQVASVPQVEMAALCDIREEALNAMGKRYGVQGRYTDHRRMFAEAKLNAVAVITSADAHYPIVRDALQANLHVLCEKPLAMETDQCWELVRLAAEKKRILAVTYTYRFVPDTRRIKEIVASGKIGKLTEIRYYRIGGEPYEKPPSGSALRREYDWIYTRAKGINFDCGIHAFDFFRWLAGSEVKRIDARGACHVDNPYPDAATAILEFENGIKAVYDHGSLPHYDPTMPSRSFFCILVSGTDGSVVWGLGEDRGQRSVLRVYTADGCQEEKFPIYEKERDTQYRHFVESVQAGTLGGYFPTPEDAAKATELTEAVVKTLMESLIVSPVRR